jgi:hypothetical protein
MPLTPKGQKILRNMEREAGGEKAGKREFYASRNAGTISGVDQGRASRDGHFARIGGVNPSDRIKGRDTFKGTGGNNIATNSFVPGGKRR